MVQIIQLLEEMGENDLDFIFINHFNVLILPGCEVSSLGWLQQSAPWPLWPGSGWAPWGSVGWGPLLNLRRGRSCYWGRRMGFKPSQVLRTTGSPFILTGGLPADGALWRHTREGSVGGRGHFLGGASAEKKWGKFVCPGVQDTLRTK